MPDELSTNGSFIAQGRTASTQIDAIQHKGMEESMRLRRDTLETID